MTKNKFQATLRNMTQFALPQTHILYDVNYQLVRDLADAAFKYGASPKKEFIECETMDLYLGDIEDFVSQFDYIPNDHLVIRVDVDNYSNKVLSELILNIKTKSITITN